MSNNCDWTNRSLSMYIECFILKQFYVKVVWFDLDGVEFYVNSKSTGWKYSVNFVQGKLNLDTLKKRYWGT